LQDPLAVAVKEGQVRHPLITAHPSTGGGADSFDE